MVPLTSKRVAPKERETPLGEFIPVERSQLATAAYKKGPRTCLEKRGR